MYNSIYQALLGAKYLGIATLMAIFPSESIMPVAGYKASVGSLWLPGVILAGALGSTVGSTILYVIARSVSHKGIARLSSKYGKLLGITNKRVERAGRLFDNHAKTTVFWGRFIPGIRSAVSIPAGYQHMSPITFLLCTFFGSGLNCAMLALLGYSARGSAGQLQNMATAVSYIVGGLVVAAVAAVLLVRRQTNRSSTK